MKSKKIISLLTVLMLLVSAFSLSVSAADGSFTVQPVTDGKTSAKTGEEVEFEIVLAGTMGYVEMTVAYDATLFDYVANSFATDVEGMYIEGETTDGSFAIKYKEFTNVKDLTVATFKLKACDDATLDGASDDDAAITLTFLEANVSGGTQKLIYDKDGELLDISLVNASVKVVKAHTAPSITGVAISAATGTAGVVGTELTAATEGFVDNWNLADKSTFVWTIDGKTVSSTAKYTPVAADINKVLTVTATPAVDESLAEAPFTGEPKSSTITVVIDPAYVPTVDVAIGNEDGEILAVVPVEPTVTYDKTYEAATTYAVDYTWYAVPASATVTTAAEAITAVQNSAADVVAVTLVDGGYPVDYKDYYAVVKAEATYTIGGEAHAIKPVDYAAAMICGEPPVLKTTDDELTKLASKKLSTSTSITVEGGDDVVFESKVAPSAGTLDLTYTYDWYLIATNDGNITGASAITGDAIAKDGAQLKLSKLDKDTINGKYLVLVVTATDDLGISSSVQINYVNAITKSSGGGSGTTGSTSLVTGGVVDNTPEDDKTGEETEEDNSIKFENEEGDPTDGKTYSAAQFEDISAELYPWAYDYVDTLAKAAIVKGMDDTHYGPEYETTYGQYIALVVRTLGLTADDAATSKVISTHWSYSEVAVADTLGLLADFETINPDASIPREDMAVIAYKGILAAELEVAGEAAIEYSDAASISEYASEAVAEMTKIGILNGMGDGTFAPKAYTTRIQAAKVIGMLYALVG